MDLSTAQIAGLLSFVVLVVVLAVLVARLDGRIGSEDPGARRRESNRR